jgi:crotonobetainyl-CoA:carnitine CoA-transferase CaiB-like acyl-CoA transferase
MGADVIRVDRKSAVTSGDAGTPPPDLLARGRRSVGVDLKRPDGAEVVLALAEQADALIEGFRPGVAERLGIGPDKCHGRNPRLVYGRMTGWGQDAPHAGAAGHDINYISLAGVLGAIGRAGEAPVPPMSAAFRSSGESVNDRTEFRSLPVTVARWIFDRMKVRSMAALTVLGGVRRSRCKRRGAG